MRIGAILLALATLLTPAAASPLALVTVTFSGQRLVSVDDGATWTPAAPEPRHIPVRALASAGERFLALGGSAEEGGCAWVSSPLPPQNPAAPLPWVALPPIPGPPISTVAYGRGRFVAVQGGTLLWCDDRPRIERLTPGERLPFVAEGAEIRPLASAFGDTEAGFCFSVIGEADLPGQGEHITWRAVSVDGTHWEWSTTGTPPARDLVYGAGIFVLVGPGGAVESSHDGQTWTRRESGTTEDLLALHWDGERFLASGTHLFTSPDGLTWKAEPLELPRPLLWAGPKLAFSLDWQGRLTRTTDFRTWTPVTPPGLAPVTAVARLAKPE